MFGNRKVTSLSLAGVILMALGTVLGLIAVPTPDWVEAPLAAVVGTDVGAPDGKCQIGLWEICCEDAGASNECFPGARNVSTAIQALRILLTVSVVWMAISTILVLVFIFKDFRGHTETVKQWIAFFFSIGTVLYLTVVMAYAMTEYKADPGFFQVPEDKEHSSGTFKSSFFLAVVGSLLTPIGVFLICTQWHLTEDREAGVENDYDGKFTEDTYI